jgi:hypothetical protein
MSRGFTGRFRGPSSYLARMNADTLRKGILPVADHKAHQQGREASATGKPYSSNPYSIPEFKLAWSKGHNTFRTQSALAEQEA